MDRGVLTSQLQKEVDRLLTNTDNVDAVFAAYLDANQKLYQVFFGDSCCNFTLRGPAFDTAMPFLEWSDDDSIRIHLGRIQAVFTCDACAVVVQGSTSSKEKYGKDSKIPVLCIESSSGSNSGLFNLVEIAGASNGQGEKKIQTNLQTIQTYGLNFLKHQQSRVLFSKPTNFVMDDSKANLLGPVETDVIALPVSLAIECHQYSETDWLARNQPWLSSDVARRAAASIVYVVPAFSVNTGCLKNVPDINDMQWRFDFSNLEAVLVADWSRAAKLVYHILLRVIPTVCRVESCIFPFDILVKYAIFWTMERSVINKSLEAENLITWCLSVCDTLESFVHAKHFPHYFMPNVNVLCRFVSSSCNLSICNHSNPDSNLYHDYIPATVPKSHGDTNHMVFDDQLVERAIIRQLEDVFKQTVSLLNLQLYQQIHSSASAACRIRLHCEKIAHLRDSFASFPREIIDGIVEWITSSLGIEYHIEANMCESASEKNGYLIKAEECLMHYQNLQSISLLSAANFANHLIVRGRVLEALSLLRNPSLLCCTPDWSHLEEIEFDKKMFHCRFTALWLHVTHTMDCMFSEHVKPVLLKQFACSLPLLECQILGATEYPVFVIRSKFLISYLTAQCLKLLNQRDEMLDLLVRTESSTAETWVMNVAEDRNQIAYFNLLAGLYADVNNISEAIRLFKKSRTIMKNPRNTAHWSMIAIQTRQWFRKMFKRWIGIVAGAVAGVLLLKYLCRD